MRHVFALLAVLPACVESTGSVPDAAQPVLAGLVEPELVIVRDHANHYAVMVQTQDASGECPTIEPSTLGGSMFGQAAEPSGGGIVDYKCVAARLWKTFDDAFDPSTDGNEEVVIEDASARFTATFSFALTHPYRCDFVSTTGASSESLRTGDVLHFRWSPPEDLSRATPSATMMGRTIAEANAREVVIFDTVLTVTDASAGDMTFTVPNVLPSDQGPIADQWLVIQMPFFTEQAMSCVGPTSCTLRQHSSVTRSAHYSL